VGLQPNLKEIKKKKITEAKVIPLSHTHDCPHVWLDTAT
jgi:hypothetical protein